MIAIAEYSDARQASIAAGMLENNGIHCTVVDDAMSTLYGAGSTWAPVRLFVPEADADEARRLLREHGDN